MDFDVITISREAGSQGDAIGYELARRLEFTVIHKRFVDLIARKARVAPWQVDRIERAHPTERATPPAPPAEGAGDQGGQTAYHEDEPGSFQALIRRLGYGEAMSSRDYVQALRAVIEDIARIGRAVIIGRGAQVVLHGRPRTFHVRVLAPRHERIESMHQTFGLDLKEAEAAMTRVDELRSELIDELGCPDINDPALYDVVLDTSHTTVADCVDELVALLDQHQPAEQGDPA